MATKTAVVLNTDHGQIRISVLRWLAGISVLYKCVVCFTCRRVN